MENAQIEQFEVTPADTASTRCRWERWVRRFDNFVVAKGITNDTRIKAMMLHHAGETVFELSESVGVLDTDTYAVTREKLRYGRTLESTIQQSLAMGNSTRHVYDVY